MPRTKKAPVDKPTETPVDTPVETALVIVTAAELKVGSMTVAKGARIRLPVDRAAKAEKAGHIRIIPEA